MHIGSRLDTCKKGDIEQFDFPEQKKIRHNANFASHARDQNVEGFLGRQSPSPQSRYVLMKAENRKTQTLSGMHAAIPVVLGFIPVGIAFAIMARQAGFTIAQTCGMSLSVFAGASQMMTVGMYAQGASVAAMVLATFLLNFRHVIMSTCIWDRMKDGSLPVRLLSAFGVTDESFALFTTERDEKKCTVAYFIGMNCVMYASWNVGTLIGAVASDFLPAIVTASLGIALYAMFIGLIMPGLTRNRKLCALVGITAVCNTLLTQIMAPSWALVTSTLLCAFLGVFFVDSDDDRQEAEDAQR